MAEINVTNLAEMSGLAIFDGLQKRLRQARGIADLLRCGENAAIDDESRDSAVWAVKELLDQTDEYASALLNKVTPAAK